MVRFEGFWGREKEERSICCAVTTPASSAANKDAACDACVDLFSQ